MLRMNLCLKYYKVLHILFNEHILTYTRHWTGLSLVQTMAWCRKQAPSRQQTNVNLFSVGSFGTKSFQTWFSVGSFRTKSFQTWFQNVLWVSANMVIIGRDKDLLPIVFQCWLPGINFSELSLKFENIIRKAPVNLICKMMEILFRYW